MSMFKAMANTNRYMMYIVIPAGLLMFSVLYAQQTRTMLSAEQRAIQAAFKRSYAAEAQGKYDLAIEAIKHLVWEKHKRNYALQARLGWLYAQNNDHTRSISHYKEAIRLHPSSVECRVGIMAPYIATKKFKEAEFYGKQAVSMDSGSYWGTLRLCYVKRMLGDFDSSRILATRMLKKYPTDVNFLVEQGYSYAGKKDQKTAISIFKKVLIYDEDNQWASSYLNSVR